MESSKETGCQAPEGPILCINNCGFFGSATTMNMCSKCHKDMVLKQHQAKLASTSIQTIINGTTTTTTTTIIPTPAVVSVEAGPAQLKTPIPGPSSGPNRCATCRKRVGLTGFSCRCGNLFCSLHRYSDKHECQFDYRTAAQDAIAKANPLVKADKLDKI